ncbi:MAG: hypothetical protein NWE83_02460 [Candidatus Bathyarchaeota archaeon]|nr:hypothetical protein [Candidatus Bathyarchaeota archaeon]
MKVVVMFYKDTGEIDPNWDYYSIRIQIEDIYSKNDPYVNPGDANVWVNCPSQAQEAPINHKPTAGFYSGEGDITFSFHGISYTIHRNAKYVYYNEFSNGPGHRGFHWDITSVTGGI